MISRMSGVAEFAVRSGNSIGVDNISAVIFHDLYKKYAHMPGIEFKLNKNIYIYDSNFLCEEYIMVWPSF
jgi:hypothetical protein